MKCFEVSNSVLWKNKYRPFPMKNKNNNRKSEQLVLFEYGVLNEFGDPHFYFKIQVPI